ncbi:MAG: sulfatase [Verrucomicrobiales bacterium]|nr:sulfatase [Verrucomicrobiales bacterium]
MRWCLALGLLTGWMLPTELTAEKSATDSRPNILFCIADDWSWPHAGVYGDPVVRTPTFDRLAREGVLFTHAFSAAPSCTPSRAAILAGRYPHQLETGANLYGPLPAKYPVYPDLLEAAGYVVGYSGKGWSPGDFEAGGRTRNPSGPRFQNFQEFLKTVPPDKPFCFWFGSHDPHRPYDKGSGAAAGLRAEAVRVPPYLPDTPEVRQDILDYYAEVERFDRDVGRMLAALERAGRASNTLVVVTADNGWPFPRSKANLYDAGTRQTLAVRWPARVPAGRTVSAFVNLAELGPTFLEAAGVKRPPEMTMRSLMPLLEGKTQRGRDMVFLERERHANVRRGHLGYPARAVRTARFLYIRNLAPERWPAGDPELWHSVGPFGDCDGSPTKDFILAHRDEPQGRRFFELCFAKRPAEELYDLDKDPDQIVNVAGRPEYAAALKRLRAELERWMRNSGDPRLHGDDGFDRFPYSGAPVRGAPGATGATSPPES